MSNKSSLSFKGISLNKTWTVSTRGQRLNIDLLASLSNAIQHMGSAGNRQKDMHFKSIMYFLPTNNVVRKSRMYFLVETVHYVQLT